MVAIVQDQEFEQELAEEEGITLWQQALAETARKNATDVAAHKPKAPTNLLEGLREAVNAQEAPQWDYLYVRVRKSHLELIERVSKMSGRIDLLDEIEHRAVPFYLKLKLYFDRNWYDTEQAKKSEHIHIGSERMVHRHEIIKVMVVCDSTIFRGNDPRVQDMMDQFYMVKLFLQATFDGFREINAPEANKIAMAQFKELEDRLGKGFLQTGIMEVSDEGERTVTRNIKATIVQAPEALRKETTDAASGVSSGSEETAPGGN